MELFAEIVNDSQLLNMFAKISFLDGPYGGFFIVNLNIFDILFLEFLLLDLDR